MAATSSPPCHISVSFLRHLPSTTTVQFVGLLPPASRTNRKLGRLTVTRSNLAQDFLGDFGARDPYPEEIASQFGDKVLGCQSTEHKILIPNASVLSLSQLQCSPVSPLQAPLSADDAKQLLHKVLGWSIVEDKTGGLKIRCMWKVRDSGCGVELINRIQKVAEASGHYPSLHLENPTQVRAELSTSSIGGLSMNDFIMAAKIDDIKTSDLSPRKRAWA
ncbi:putative pterin-4-alpha-carbinolamine dehydratase [Cardamine amara subsp. amara]|uniref:4a-hydroxytetrahydrobiopterin dehydratase n=1 Tax=Cardamine amara subsp. amara TaxID=228776 RepID=A0ABD1A8F5_CARAN